MVRILLFTLWLLGLVVSTTGTAMAGKMDFTYSDYIHMSEPQKEEYLKTVMKLMVELEERYRKDSRTGDTFSEEFQLYTQLLRELHSVFIPEAHAAAGDWNDYASRLTSIINNSANTSNLCVFAGWASTVNSKTGKCTHPRSGGHNSAYLNKSGCNGNQVTCNPVIFGYAKKDSQTPFCVDTRDEARNSSLDCMQAALKDPAENGNDSKQVRLDDMKARLTPAVVNSIYKFMFKTCVCESTPVMNEGYAGKIRPHRTCFGLMNMMANVKASCPQETFSSLNSSFFTTLQGITVSADDFQCRRPGCDIDTNYNRARSSYRESARGADRSFLTEACTGDNLGRGPAEDDQTARDRPTPDAGCVATCAAGEGTNPPTCSAYKRGDQTLTAASGTTPAFSENNTKVTIQVAKPAGQSGNDSVLCTIQAPEETPECVAKCTPGADENANPSCTEYKRGEKVLTPTSGTTPTFNTEKTQVTINTTLEGKTSAENIACRIDSGDRPAETGKDMDLVVTLGKQTRTQQTVTATIKEKGKTEEFEVDSFEWYTRDIEGDSEGDDEEEDSGKDKEATRTVGAALDETPVVEDDEETSVEGMDKDEEKGKTLTVGRKTNDVEVCALAKKAGFKTKKECVTVEKLKARDAQPGTGAGGMQLGAPGGSRALGIQ